MPADVFADGHQKNKSLSNLVEKQDEKTDSGFVAVYSL